jgi:penicillin-binding protein 1C
VLRPVGWLPATARRGGKRVLSAQTAYIVSDMLADKAARGLTFGLTSPLETIGISSVKTGTSKDMRDNWCIGYTDRYTVGVWVGNDSGAPMRDVSGISGAAPIWQAVMNRLQHKRPGQMGKSPPGVESRTVHYEPAIEPDRRELFLAGTALELIAIPAEELNPRIDGPGNGAILARDPDIPAERQKVRFRIKGMSSGLAWYVDDKSAEPLWLDVDGSLLWPLVSGAHRISVRAADGKTIDAMFVTVK